MSVQLIHFDNAPALPFSDPVAYGFAIIKEGTAAQSNSRLSGEVLQSVFLIPDHLKTAMTVKILSEAGVDNVIIYVKTNFDADHLAENINRAGFTAESFHNNKSQRTKSRTLSNFRTKATSVLVITESAASDISVGEVTVIINYNLPVSAETYIERLNYHSNSAGPPVKVFSFCDRTEHGYLANINRALVSEIDTFEACAA